MNTKYFIQNSLRGILGCFVCCTIAATFSACSDNDDDDNYNVVNRARQGQGQKAATVAYDDLDFFQRAIIDMDSVGTFRGREWGVPRNVNDTTHLFIGVETLAEAEEIFREWVAPDMELTASGKNLSSSLTDQEGELQGTLYFTPSSEGGTVAEVTVSPETKLKHFSRITFLHNSVWGFNSAKSRWHVGDIVRDVRFKDISPVGVRDLDSRDQALNYVCIREGGNGVMPMFCAITNKSYKWPGYDETYGLGYSELVHSKYCPSLSTAESIHKILSKDWDFFVALFDEAGEGKLGKRPYWIDHRQDKIIMAYVQLYFYDSGYNYGSKKFDDDEAPILVKMDYWISDTGFNDGGTY